MVRTAPRPHLLTAALLVIPVFAAANPVTVIVSANLERIFPALSPNEELHKADLKFEEVLGKLREEDPDAFVVDAGRHQSITHTNETGYAVPVWNVFDFTDYQVVNLDAREALTGTDGLFGLEMAPESFRERTITTTVSSRHEPLNLPATRIVDKGGTKLAFVSLTDPAAARALGGWLAQTQRLPIADVTKAIEGASSEGIATIAFASGTRFIPEFPSEAATPDVILTFDEVGDPKQVKTPKGAYWLVPVPPPGHLMKMELTVDQGKVSAAPVTRLVPFVESAALDQMIVFPPAQIGVLIPNLENILTQFFDLPGGAASLDRYPLEPVSDLTTVAPNVYSLPTQDGTRRIYRVMSKMPYYEFLGELDPNWPPMDMLVVLDDKSQFQRIITRIEFPIGGTNSVVLEDFARRRGTNPDEWKFDPEAAGGLPEVWQWIATTVRQVAELDRRLHAQ